MRQNPDAQEQVDHHRDAEDQRCAGEKDGKHRQSEAHHYERTENRQGPRWLAGARGTAGREIETAAEQLSLSDPDVEQHPVRLGEPGGEVQVKHAGRVPQPAEQEDDTEALQELVHAGMICDCSSTGQGCIGARKFAVARKKAAWASAEGRARWMLGPSFEMFVLTLSPFRRMACLSVVAAWLGANAASSFAQPIFFTVASTPYDRQMSAISPILNSPAGPLAGRTSVTTVNQWITSLRAIPYQYSQQWKTPAQVHSDVVADCKGKAILLYAILRAKGAMHVRFVIGKRHLADLRTHAWLEWKTTSGTYLLDPTFNSAIERIEVQDPATYIPHYAYNGSRKYRAGYYRAPSASVVASN